MFKKYKYGAVVCLAIGVATCCYMPSQAEAVCTIDQCNAAKQACNSGTVQWNYNTDCALWYACDEQSKQDCTNRGCSHADYRCRMGKEPFQTGG